MSITVNGLVFDNLLAQPLNYSVTDIYAGSSARIWEIQGLCSKEDYASIISIYDTWRNNKIAEDHPKATLVIASAVTFSGTGPGGLTWSNVSCWFHSAPQGSMVSSQYMTVSFALVDASQAIEQFIKDGSTDIAGTDNFDYGTYSLAGATIYLTKDPYTFTDLPTISRAANGTNVISGSFLAYELHDIEGRCDNASKAAIISWFRTTVQSTSAQLMPVSAPAWGYENKTNIDGEVELWNTVSMQIQVLQN